MTRLVSSDSHIVEPPDVYQRYAPRRWQGLAPRLVLSARLGEVFACEGMSLVLPVSEILGGDPCGFREVPLAAYRPRERIDLLARDKVAAELLFPTVGLFLEQHPDREYLHEFAWAYNRWLADEWIGVPGLYPMMMFGGQDSPKAKRTAIGFAVDNRMRGVLLPSSPSNGCWASPEHKDFFNDLAEAGLLVGFHVFSRPVRPRILRAAAALFTAAHEAMDTASELVVGGILGSNPDLRVIFGEGQSWWLGEWIRRVAGLRAVTDELPAWSRQIRVTDATYPLVGGGLVSWANDFPHGLHDGAKGERNSAHESFHDGSFWLVDSDRSHHAEP